MSKFDRDELFIAFQRLGRNGREAEAILDKIYERHGSFIFETDFESARLLANQFHGHNALYRVILLAPGEAQSRRQDRIRCGLEDGEQGQVLR